MHPYLSRRFMLILKFPSQKFERNQTTNATYSKDSTLYFDGFTGSQTASITISRKTVLRPICHIPSQRVVISLCKMHHQNQLISNNCVNQVLDRLRKSSAIFILEEISPSQSVARGQEKFCDVHPGRNIPLIECSAQLLIHFFFLFYLFFQLSSVYLFTKKKNREFILDNFTCFHMFAFHFYYFKQKL